MGRPIVLALLATVVVAAAAVALAVTTGDGHAGSPPPTRAGSAPRTSARGTPRPATGPRQLLALARPAEDPRRLAAQLDWAQHVVEDPASPARQLARAGLLEQLGTGVLQRDGARRREVLAALSPSAAAMMRAALAAASALAPLVTPQRTLPRGWRIVRPVGPRRLIADLRAAQAASGVPWQILAAIALTETRMGRIRGPSTAGARGPMQFMPATWARFGRGNINNTRDAIMAAARLLAASGAPEDISRALYHYNPARGYVRGVEIYAREMKHDARAFDAFYNWQVLYRRVDGLLLLPVGYPAVRPQRVR